ncbi:MAG: hypothetical protein A2Z29_04805 [Chloroflexi bacterium RBG_16_56_11]|nr:MAG: hypothetical protein A2Z29_04805 [Chloroflexi bacterium RBG_16_56_11]
MFASSKRLQDREIEVTRGDSVQAGENAPEIMPGNTASCPVCRGKAVFMLDEKVGYYKQCADCGHVEHLNRRFLRLDRSSRRWQ